MTSKDYNHNLTKYKQIRQVKKALVYIYFSIKSSEYPLHMLLWRNKKSIYLDNSFIWSFGNEHDQSAQLFP